MRKATAKSRKIVSDPKYNEVLVTRFVNCLMKNGKKEVAFKIFYDAIDMVEEKTKTQGLEVWKKALTNVTPHVEVRSRRIGGATFQIPQPIRDDRKISMAIKWMIQYAFKRGGKPMHKRLAEEIIAASKEEGSTFKKKEDTHKMAEANKAFSHFRF